VLVLVSSCQGIVQSGRAEAELVFDQHVSARAPSCPESSREGTVPLCREALSQGEAEYLDPNRGIVLTGCGNAQTGSVLQRHGSAYYGHEQQSRGKAQTRWSWYRVAKAG
jgi:hypothetical protein